MTSNLKELENTFIQPFKVDINNFLKSTTRYGSSPAYKNTFVNFYGSKSSSHFE